MRKKNKNLMIVINNLLQNFRKEFKLGYLR